MITLRARHRLRHGLLGNAECQVYEADDTSVAVAIVYGRVIPDEEILVRIHSACIYGEVLLATDCDCRAQLNQSLRDIREAGCGIIIRLEQEGRGAGLATKAQAYELLDREGLDTVDAYRRMKVDLDSRRYDIAIDILRKLGIERVRLITNNPRKVAALRESGLSVTRMRQKLAATDANIDYLRVKALKLGHLLELPRAPEEEGDGYVFRSVVVGAAVMDHIVKLFESPTLGSARQATGYRRQPGGKGLNQAIALSRLGVVSRLLASRGADSDALEISEALVAESVGTWFIDADEVRSPQTLIIQPRDSQPTYVGWLSSEYRKLSAQRISRWSAEIGASDAVLFTLEASPKTIDAVLTYVSDRTLKVLTAAPSFEGRRISTTLLERLDVVIGSESELRALHGESEGNESIASIVRNLTEFCGLTVIVTDLKSPIRTVRGFNQVLDKIVAVESPRVRAFDRLAAAVGNADAFSAAFVLSALRRGRSFNGSAEPLSWQGRKSFFSEGTNLLDVLLEAVVVEAWVVKSGAGGYSTFPTQTEIQEWSHQPPRALDELEASQGWVSEDI
jgi:GTP cyclohydrolase II